VENHPYSRQLVITLESLSLFDIHLAPTVKQHPQPGRPFFQRRGAKAPWFDDGCEFRGSKGIEAGRIVFPTDFQAEIASPFEVAAGKGQEGALFLRREDVDYVGAKDEVHVKTGALQESSIKERDGGTIGSQAGKLGRQVRGPEGKAKVGQVQAIAKVACAKIENPLDAPLGEALCPAEDEG
jgi:hypothetical protein